MKGEFGPETPDLSIEAKEGLIVAIMPEGSRKEMFDGVNAGDTEIGPKVFLK